MDYLRIHVLSYQEFKSLVEQYVNKGGAAVSFDKSDNVDAQSYGFMLDDVLTNNSKLGRFDKIKIQERITAHFRFCVVTP